MNANVLGFIQRALILSLLLLPNIAQAQDFTSGLVGHWTLDETSGASIADSSGTGNSGTWIDNVNNDVAEESTTGTNANAITFDGVDDYVRIPDDASLDITTAVTLAAWVRHDGGDNGGIICKQDGNNSNNTNYCLYISNAGTYSFSLGDGSPQYAESATTPDTNWHHFVGVADGTNVTLYLDGVQFYQETQNRTLTASTLDVFLGTWDSGDTSSFTNSSIDDARVYNRGLSAADVAALYAYNGESATCTNPDGFTGEMHFNNDINVLQYCNSATWVAVGPKSTLSSGLGGHWELDETSGSTIIDSGPNAINGTWNDGSGNSVVEETAPGKISTAINFDGTDDVISIPDSPSLDISGPLTITFWVNMDNFGGNPNYQDFIIKWNGTSANYLIHTNASQQVCVVNTVSNCSSYTLSTGSWTHITVVMSSNTNSNLYVNGVYVESISQGYGPVNNNPLTFGDWESGGEQINGSMDDVRIYNRILSVYEITKLYNAAPSCAAPTANLQGHWTLNETTGSSIADSGGSNTGTWADGSGNSVAEETVTAQDGTGITFDGVDDAINVGSDASIDDVFVGGGTVSAWIYPLSSGGGTWGRILDKSASTIADGGWAFQMDAGGNDIVFQVSCTSDRYSWTTNGSVTPFNQWSQVTITFDNSSIANAPTIYVNGSVVSASRVNSCAGTFDVDAGSDLFIGNYQSGSRGFDGTIDDVRIYNRILTSSEISEIYGASGGICTGGKCTSPPASTGEIVFNTDVDAMQYCNGSNWIAMGPPGNGGAGTCTSPAGLTAELRYNSDVNALQYCEGDEWIAVLGQPSFSIPTAGLIGHWTLDDTSGSTIVDSSTSALNGTWNDNADNDVTGETTAGQVGTGINFDGTDDEITITGLMGNPSVVTFSAWVNLTSADTKGGDIFSIGDTVALRADDGLYGATGFYYDGTTWRYATSSIDIEGTGWRHLVYVADPGNSDQRLYLDGTLIGSSSFSGAISYGGLGSNTKIGTHANGDPDFDFGGAIDDVRIYDRALTATEINNLYLATN